MLVENLEACIIINSIFNKKIIIWGFYLKCNYIYTCYEEVASLYKLFEIRKNVVLPLNKK